LTYNNFYNKKGFLRKKWTYNRKKLNMRLFRFLSNH
jgi:hypothetical protein